MDLNNKLQNNQFNKNQAHPTAPQNKQDTIGNLIMKMRGQIELALPKHLTADRLARIALTAVRNNDRLANCNVNSLLGAIMQSAQLGLEPNTPLGQCYIIPYNSKNGAEAQFQIGYKGIIDLAYRSGQYKNIYAMEVYENDVFQYQYGLDTNLVHIPTDIPNGEPVKYYAVYKLQNGGADFRVWSKEKILKHAEKYSKAVQKGWTSPWQTDFDAMAKKTVLIDLLKYAPKSIEFSREISADETIKYDISKDMLEVQSHHPQPAEENTARQPLPPETIQPENNGKKENDESRKSIKKDDFPQKKDEKIVKNEEKTNNSLIDEDDDFAEIENSFDAVIDVEETEKREKEKSFFAGQPLFSDKNLPKGVL